MIIPISTARATGNMSGLTLMTTPINQKARLMAVDINNQGYSGAPLVVNITDTFTPSVGVINPSPVSQTKVRLSTFVASGQFLSLGKDNAMEVDFLGIMAAITSYTDSGIQIIAKYQLI
jgi:hypothetical protein